MDKQSAIKLIRETFEKSFDKDQFVYFIKNLFNKIMVDPFEFHGQYIPDTFKPYINKYERIGKYIMEDKRIDILIVYLNKETSIERARTIQRNFVAGYLTGKYGSDIEKDAAVVAFISPNEEDWRFSLVKMEYKLTQTRTGRPKGEEEWTPAKRFSFLVGKNEHSHTAQQQLLPVLQDDINNPTLDQIEKAFSVEKVAKEFLNKYRYLYLNLKESIDRIVKKGEDVKEEFEKKNINTIDFSKKLLGQIVFLYFLQKKGWLDVPSNKNWGEGDRNFLRSLFNKCAREKKNFFNDYLEILFYNTLNNPRLDRADPSYSKHFDCRIPFLNGGLFEPINNYNWKQTDIIISNELFSNNERTKEGDIGSGILDVFDRFNFTVREDEPLEKEVALDPELLGKVFENLIEENLRKGQGAYYTPREIVHYMCQESLINYLASEIEDKANKKDIEVLIKYGDITIEHDKLVIAKKEENPEYNGKYKKIKMPESIKSNAGLIDEKLANIRVCDPAVGSGAFPVGTMLEIVKARNVLTNYLSDKEDRTPYIFKRQCIENCLYGVDIDSSAIDIAKLRFWLSLVVDEEDVTKIKPLPNLDYKLVCGNSLLGVERDVLNWQLFDHLEELKPLFFNETDMNKKQEYKKQIDKLIKQITNNDEHFDFEVYFSEVFHEKKGFDVVIANPPYVRQEDIKDQKPFLQRSGYEVYNSTSDLYTYFYEKSYQILKQSGFSCFISSNKWMRAKYGEKIRKFFKEKTTLKQIIDFNGYKVFDATVDTNILLFQKTKPADNTVNILNIQQDFTKDTAISNYFQNHILKMKQSALDVKCFTFGDETVMELKAKIEKIGTPLKDWDVKICFGIKTGFNEAFIIDTAKRDELIEKDPKNTEIIKPILRGRDIYKYHYKWAGLWLINSHNGLKSKEIKRIDVKKNYSVIYKHLQQFQKKLEKREDKGEHWTNLRNCAYLDEFEKEKIVWREIVREPSFAYDTKNIYCEATTFLMTGKRLKYLIAILSSTPVTFFFRQFYAGGGLGESGYRYKKAFLKQLPIPKISESDQKPFIELVDKILAITKDSDYLENPLKQAKVKEYERQIDQMVYELYGLTKEEIKIIEGKA